MPKTLHLVPQFHYDIEYLLPLEPYLEVCFENLLEARRLAGLHPDFTYLVEQVFLLEQFFREYPSLLPEFRAMAEAGRFEVSSGMYAMADQNMPSGESLLRQMTVGKAWCEGDLGHTPRAFNAGDCTGAGPQFPQMIRHCGYDYYVFMRAVDDPARKSEVRWRGIDGTEVPTYWLAEGYSGWLPPVFTTCPPADGPRTGPETAVETVVEHAINDDVLLPQGGDFVHPSEAAPRVIAEWNAAHSDKRIVYSTYSRALDTMTWDRAPVHEGEWNPDRTGTYSSRIAIKQENRACEALLCTAEALSTLARERSGEAVDDDGLLRAWKLTFVNQFHDTLWGTVCDEAHLRALDRAKQVRTVLQRIIESRLQTVLDSQAEAPAGRQIAVFNPLPWPRTADVRVPTDAQALGLDPAADLDVSETRRVRVELPACGYRVVDLPEADADAEAPFAATPSDDGGFEVETPHYRAALAPSGVISRLTRKRDGLDVVDPKRPWLNVLCIQTDQGDLWQYYEGPMGPGGDYDKADDRIDDPFPTGIGLSKNGRRSVGLAMDTRTRPAEVEVVERSRDRLVFRATGDFETRWPNFREWRVARGDIRYEQTTTFYADTPRVDFRLVLEPGREKWYRARAAFFTGIEDGRILHEVPFGRFARPEGEFAAQNYMAYLDADRGLALFNRGLPGNNVTDGVMMLSLMRSVSIYSRVESDLAFEQDTRHVFDYAILPFAGERELDAARLAREGLEFACPPYVFERHPDRLPTPADAPLPAEDTLVTVKPDSVVCVAVRPVDGGVMLRLYESSGRPTESGAMFSQDVKEAAETDALLRDPRPIETCEGRLLLAFQPFEIKTLRVRI